MRSVQGAELACKLIEDISRRTLEAHAASPGASGHDRSLQPFLEPNAARWRHGLRAHARASAISRSAPPAFSAGEHSTSEVATCRSGTLQ